MKAIIIILLFVLSFSLHSQTKDTIPKYFIHSLADTSIHPEYIPYINHWIDFLYTENDSLRKTYWDPKDIQKWGDGYALFYGGIFQYPVSVTLSFLKPYILSVYCKNGHCQITTAFWKLNSDPTTEISKNQNPYGIVEVEIYQKDGEMYISNLYEKRIANWNKLIAGKIKYIIDPELKADTVAIKKAKHFVDSLSGLLNVDYDSITYVVTNSPNTLGYILGFNYFFMGRTNGRVSYEGRTIFSGVGTFNYPHELSHLIINQLLQAKNQLFGEGLTSYFGGNYNYRNEKNMTFEEGIKDFQKLFPIINDSIFSKINKYPNASPAYILGALIVEQIYLDKGINGLKALADTGEKPEDLLNAISKKFNINRKELFQAINTRLDTL